MDEKLQAQVDEAKAAGYSDEEIQQYLASKDQPIQQEQPIDRSGEYGATAMSAIPTAIELGAAGYGVKKLAEGFRGGPVAPPVTQPGSPLQSIKTVMTPSQPTLNPTWDAALKQPVAQQPSMIERGTQYAREMQRIAAEKVMQGARAAAPYAAPIARGAGAAAAALTPSNIGQNYPVPQSGPYRGMEINPNTGRPWTNEELAGMR